MVLSPDHFNELIINSNHFKTIDLNSVITNVNIPVSLFLYNQFSIFSTNRNYLERSVLCHGHFILYNNYQVKELLQGPQTVQSLFKEMTWV